LSFAIVLFTPITVAVNRAKANIFERPSILFRPHDPANDGISGGVAGYRPRVRTAYYMRVYHHIPRRDDLYIEAGACSFKVSLVWYIWRGLNYFIARIVKKPSKDKTVLDTYAVMV